MESVDGKPDSGLWHECSQRWMQVKLEISIKQPDEEAQKYREIDEVHGV
jgi:hypothetical protein